MVRAVSDVVERLMSDVEWALAHELPPRELTPMLEKLLNHAPPHSHAALFAKRHLAGLIVEHSPFRAARLARDVLAFEQDDRAWAILGLAHTLLGNFHCAAKAYRYALSLSPDCPWYAHNLGHLLDVGLDRPRDALRLLRLAFRAVPKEPEIAASYAHALSRCGDQEQAREMLLRALGSAEAADEMLASWLSRPTKVRPATQDSHSEGDVADRESGVTPTAAPSESLDVDDDSKDSRLGQRY